MLITLSLTEPNPVQLRELAQSLSTPRSTLHRVLQTLEAMGMVKRIDRVGYVLGDETRHLGSRYRVKELPRLSEPILQEVRRMTSESVNLAIAQRDAMLIVAAVQSPQRLRTVSPVGTRDLFHASALGKAYLAALPEDRLRTIVQAPLAALTERTITNRTDLMKEIRRSQERGYALDDEEAVIGVRCIGVAILGEGEHPIGAVSVMGPKSRLGTDDIKRVGLQLVRAAERISSLLGATENLADTNIPLGAKPVAEHA